LKKVSMFCAALLWACTQIVVAQEAAPQPPPQADTEDHRMFGVLPNFKTVNNPDQPITAIGAKEKFGLVLHYFDPFSFAIAGVQAGIEQETNAKKAYGQGMLGYAKRYGADFTDAGTNELFVVGVYPSLFHEDPRYFRLGHGSAFHRIGYAVSRILIARTDSGSHRFNTSEFLGNFTSGAISQTYYPRDERGFGGVATRATVQIAYDAMFNVLKEFYPDIRNKLHRK
jgi:hypothetical protein